MFTFRDSFAYALRGICKSARNLQREQLRARRLKRRLEAGQLVRRPSQSAAHAEVALAVRMVRDKT